MKNDFIGFIQNRVSVPRLDAPAPTPEQLNEVVKAALRAPDHMMLRSTRYLSIEGDSRERLGEVFLQAALAENSELNTAQQQKFSAMPMRAPLILVAVSANKPHPKVPVLEQEVSAGVGLGYALLALRSMGFNGIWRTGVMAESSLVKSALNIADHETLVGFLYVGTTVGEEKKLPELSPDDFLEAW